MKKQITITQEEFQKAVTDTLDFLEQAAKNNPKNSNPIFHLRCEAHAHIIPRR